MTSERTKQNFVNIIQKRGREWVDDPIPVIAGKRDGTVDAGGGYIWVRFSNGDEKKVLNTLAPVKFDWHIRVGRTRTSPNVWRVAEIRNTYLESQNDNMRAHAEQHQLGNFDPVFLNRKQIMSATMFVSDAVNFKVRVYGGLFPTPDGWMMAESTDGTAAHPDIDLSSYIPATGAKYVSIESDDTGALVINEGAVFETAELAPLDNVPVVPAGNRLIGFALLYENQPELTNDDIYLPGLFMTDYAAVETGYQIDNAPADTPLDADKWGFWDVVDNALKSITWANIKATLKTYFDVLYVNKNVAITGATKTKITYDAKGLVTAGADATQDDIGDGTTYKQYSATEKTKLAGIETGADVTDNDNVNTALTASISSTNPTTGVFFYKDIIDTLLYKVTWLNIRNALETYFNTLFDAVGAATTAENNAKSYADGLVVGLWDDRGSFDASGGAYPSSGGSGTAGAILKGDVWTISVAGSLPTGQVVEVGDIVRALVNTPGNTQANWAITQNNIGYTAENSANKDTDGTLAANSDTKYPSQKATKTYADNVSSNASVIAKVLTAFSAGAGTVSATDSILQAFQKVVGNIALKLTANSPITGATKTKITYDANGLVTAGADIAASDLPTGIDAAKISGGSVSNAEFDRLDGVTSAIQTQLDAKLPLAGGTMTGAIDLDEHQLKGKNFAISDDTAQSFTPDSAVGMLLLHGGSGGTAQWYAIILYRVGASPYTTNIVKHASVDLTTGSLAGTTGTDTHFTISAATDGKIYIENRTGLTANPIVQMITGT